MSTLKEEVVRHIWTILALEVGRTWICLCLLAAQLYIRNAIFSFRDTWVSALHSTGKGFLCPYYVPG